MTTIASWLANFRRFWIAILKFRIYANWKNKQIVNNGHLNCPVTHVARELFFSGRSSLCGAHKKVSCTATKSFLAVLVENLSVFWTNFEPMNFVDSQKSLDESSASCAVPLQPTYRERLPVWLSQFEWNLNSVLWIGFEDYNHPDWASYISCPEAYPGNWVEAIRLRRIRNDQSKCWLVSLMSGSPSGVWFRNFSS